MTRWLPRAWPLLPTLLVLAAVAAMIMLGVWQLKRAGQKEALIAEVRHNPALAPRSFPAVGPVTPEVTFRRSSLHCLRVVGWQVEAGRAADGSAGFRYIARCTTGAEGQGALVALGIGGRPDMKPGWAGGNIEGWISKEPDHRSLIQQLTGPEVVLRPMLVAAASPVAELKPTALPSPDDIPNNHRSYAVQWFLFAAVAFVIYVLALKRRETRAGADS
ncbi:SURF1 family protein [Sphingobium sp. DEHP117]|uniref:SURF1 family protein n=1 Tax=Sphingobium sp. DEHP117 TaxID=2993436 RepID=UPI0027D53386|nr:SURF1 family cytochrome oxidase biogenesis protein [Sphingobium sp. DEHP117]MDQ4418933.1 SURF1 family protein [Sphingobium sp. DEHP117]